MSASLAARLARERGLSPKRSFGQNFLRDRHLAERIAALAVPTEGGTVLEIGAGLGALTERLLERSARVLAVERDRDLVPILREAFAELEVVEADAVRHDWSEALRGTKPPHAVAGNLPYQISGRILERAVHHRAAAERFVFMLQREVADRVVAAPSTDAYGALSIFVQASFQATIAAKVPPGAFFPAPKVASAVVVLLPRETPLAREDPVFREVVKKAFSQRRKKLRNAWRTIAGSEDAASAAGIDLDRRGETLSVDEFAQVAEELRKQSSP